MTPPMLSRLTELEDLDCYYNSRNPAEARPDRRVPARAGLPPSDPEGAPMRSLSLALVLATAAVAYSPASAEQSDRQPEHSAGQRTEAKADQKDIVDTAVAAGQFKTLAAALKAAGLVDTLKGAGPFTVFAPTDAAFAELPAGTVENLLKPENKAQLTAILTYHVVPGKVMAADVVKLKE